MRSTKAPRSPRQGSLKAFSRSRCTARETKRSHSIQQKSAAGETLGLTRRVLAELKCVRTPAQQCKRERETGHRMSYREQRPRRGKISHSGVGGPSGPRGGGRVAKDQKEKPVLRDSRPLCCKLADRGAREHLPRTNGHAVAQYYVVMLEVPEEASARS